ncbi:MAG: hypothetical protein ABFR75_09245 [Acidobacteriota bacterium]
MNELREILNFPINLPRQKINRRLKIPGGLTHNTVESKIEKYFPLLENAARYKNLDIKIKEEKILINNKWNIVSDSLSTFLNGCNKVTILGVTTGSYLEEKMDKLQNSGNTLETMVIDALGSEGAEESAIYVSRIINREIEKEGFIPTKRFSPGYGDLSLESQNIFFKELKLNEIGIELNESLLMIPQKSITAFIGWREKNQS